MYRFVSFNVITSIIGEFYRSVSALFLFVLQAVVMPLLNIFLETLAYAYNMVYYLLYAGFLYLIDAVQQALNYLMGGEVVTYNGQRDYLLNVFLYQSGLSRAVWGVILIAVILAVLFSVVAVSKAMMSESKNSLGKTFGIIGRTMLSFLIVPFILIVSVNLTLLSLDKTDEIIALSTGMTERTKASSIAFAVTTLGAQKQPQPLSASPQDDVRYKYYTGAVSYFDLTQVQADFLMERMNLLLGTVFGIFFIYIYTCIASIFIFNLFQIMLLFIISPFFISTMPLDEGKLFKSWRELFLTRMIAGLGMITSVRVFEAVILPFFMSDSIRLFPITGNSMLGNFPDQFLKFIFITSFAYAITKSHNIITMIVNPQAADDEKMVADTVKRTAIAVAKAAAQIAIAVATAGAGTAAAAAAKAGATAAKAGAAAAKAGAAAAKTGTAVAKTGATAAKTGATAAKAGAHTAKGAAKMGQQSVGKLMSGRVKQGVKDTVKNKVQETASNVKESAKDE